ncbi:hypothetical protein L2E82_16429 [Cichorium intybus]|uniref:Uncharacterized protein n=1 Tax=Cichorium intybus TaxID=13427 RepID=A0ACB9F510_CICIN|nr:hypothetical protein L2E82_16429 [Cichorium intybus]
MPQLRSGPPRSKRLGDIQPADQAENIVSPTQNRTRKKTGGGRERGNNAAAGVAKGPMRPTGRGRGIRLINLDPEPYCEIVPNKGPVGVVEPVVNAVVDKDMEGGSADKITGVEEEGIATPVRERVQVVVEQTGPDAIEVALKFWHPNSKACNYGPPYECQVYSFFIQKHIEWMLLEFHGFTTRAGKVMGMLGPSLWDVWNSLGQSMSPSMVVCIAVEAISILEKLHAKG